MQFALISGSTGTGKAFCLGFGFRAGDVPAGSGVVASLAAIQVTVKNRWADGSVKFAVIAGRADMTASQPLAVTLSTGAAAAAGAALTTADLRATGASAAVGCGSFGTAIWSGADWDNPLSAWIAGPQMSSWIYRKAVGSDAHLVAWLEVRLYAGGAVEVLPWIENGYLRVAGPTNKTATYTFTLGTTQRFSGLIDLPHHCRTPLVSGSLLSHWLAADPAVVGRSDARYLQATELVPSYSAAVSSAASVVTSLPSSFQPLQQGNYSLVMSETGYQVAIGLLPEWDVLYLTSPELVRPVEALQRNGYSAGRFPTHYRDETTQRPLRFSAYPNLSLNASTINQVLPASSGTAPNVWDIPHHPSIGYMAYLTTGRWYFMEELQFAATRNYLWQVDNIRQFAGGVFVSSSGAATVRGAAWAIRTLAQAAVATPDDDTALRSEFLASLAANIEFNHGRYVAQANNPFGIVAPYGDAYGTATDGKVTEAAWQQDFYTAAFGYALALRPALSADASNKLQAFFAWKARCSIGRLGGTSTSEWLYRDAAQYTFVVAPADNPDWAGGTGPWFNNWGELYAASLGVSNPGAAGDLRGAYFPEGTSYWGNFLPGIAYAVRFGVPGARTAYDRMTGAANWGQMLTSLNQNPVWSVRPAS